MSRHILPKNMPFNEFETYMLLFTRKCHQISYTRCMAFLMWNFNWSYPLLESLSSLPFWRWSGQISQTIHDLDLFIGSRLAIVDFQFPTEPEPWSIRQGTSGIWPEVLSSFFEMKTNWKLKLIDDWLNSCSHWYQGNGGNLA